MRWSPFVLGLPACDAFVAGSTSTDGAFTATTTTTAISDIEIPSEAADLELAASLTNGAALLPDLGEDGSDDLVRVTDRFTDGEAIDILEQAIEIRPNVLWSPAHTFTLTTSTSHVDTTESGGILRIGPHALLPTPDATGDERPDAWLTDSDGALVLVAGPLARSVDDPLVVAEVPAGQLDLQLASDLDGDGDGEIVGRRGQDLVRCEGLFHDTIDATLCPGVPCPDVARPRAIGAGDIDGDGFTDLLVAGDGFALILVDGNFADGEPPLATVVPHAGSTFTVDSSLLADFDADGYADLAWLEDRSSWSPTEGAGVAILHAPVDKGSELDAAEITLEIFQASDGAVLSMQAPDTDGDGAASLLLATEWRPGGLLFDASLRGSLGPDDASWVLASDQAPDQVLTGEIDGDELDDILVRNASGTSWVYLGASLP